MCTLLIFVSILKYIYCCRPPFEVMEVWLESLLMHLSVGMALPSDLLFDIHHYKGQSPSSSGSTTPEGIPSGHRSPTLEPICEGQTSDTKESSRQNTSPDYTQNISENFTPPNTENLLKMKDNSFKPIIKVNGKSSLLDKMGRNYEVSRSCETICENQNLSNDLIKNNSVVISNSAGQFPNYENIDFLKNDTVFAGNVEKSICIKELKETDLCRNDKSSSILESNKCSTNCENNLKPSFNVNLRNVPKNFTRNRFAKETKENSKYTAKHDSHSVKDKFKFLSKTKTFDVKPLVNVSSKMSSLNLDGTSLKSTTLPPQLTRKITAKNVNLNGNSSCQNSPRHFKDKHSVMSKSSSFDKNFTDICNMSMPCSSKSDPTSEMKSLRSSLIKRRYTKDSENVALSRKVPTLQKRSALKSPIKEKNITSNESKIKQLDPDTLVEDSLFAEYHTENLEDPLPINTEMLGDQEIKSSFLSTLTPILQRRSGFLNFESDPDVNMKSFTATSNSGNIVRDMVDSLNQKGGLNFSSRVNFARGSLKLLETQKINTKPSGSFSSTSEFSTP